MIKARFQKLSGSQYINYLAVEIAEQLLLYPTQKDIDIIENGLKNYQKSTKKIDA